LIPYLLWSVTLFIWKGLDGWVGTPVDYLKELLLGRAAPPYYYIPLVFQFYLLSPLILPLMKKRWKPVLSSAAALQFLVLLARYPVIFGWDLPAASWIVRVTPGFTIFQSCFWFAFGIFTGFHLDILKAWVSRWRRLWPVLTAFFGLAAFVEWEVLFSLSNSDWLAPGVSILDSLYAGGVILTFLSFGQFVLPFESFWADLGAKSFGVYLMHAPVLQFVSRAVYNVAPWVLGYQLIFQPILLIAGVAIPLLVMSAFNRSPARPYYRYVFG
jgi:peptidoglycan/LPS O-acetylase OafA/YrhL